MGERNRIICGVRAHNDTEPDLIEEKHRVRCGSGSARRIGRQTRRAVGGWSAVVSRRASATTFSAAAASRKFQGLNRSK